MQKTLIVLSLALSLAFSSSPITIAQTTSPTPAVQSGDEDFGNPGILPTNPFYFIKELGRGVKLFFIFDPVSKAEYELNVANERAAEVKRIVDLDPGNTKAIERALTNYNENVARLTARLESLRQSSNNPNIDKLLERLSDRAFRHKRLFEKLKDKSTALKDRLESAGNRLLDEVIGNLKEKPVSVAEKEKLAVNEPKSPSRLKEVVVTDNGFSPKEVKIKKGDSVRWTNQSSALSWPASAIHPTHSIYPEKGGCIDSAFDACRELNKGESFTFVFNFSGSWKYHDHLNPSKVGTVVVEEGK